MLGRVRLYAAYVLFAYVTTHLLNHALGLAGPPALKAGHVWFTWLWHNPVAQTALYGAFTLHFALVLWSLFRRRALRLSRWEWLQLGLGLSIVPLAALHVTGTRIAQNYFDIDPGYGWVFASLLGSGVLGMSRQFGLVLVVWLHACIGLHFAWRLKAWYANWAPMLFALALLVPAAGIAGAGVALRDFAVLAEQPGFIADVLAGAGFVDRSVAAQLYDISYGLIALATVLVVAAFAARPLRNLWERRAGVVRLEYEGHQVSQPTGLSVLEMSRLAGIPHASVCGGRGRCSTCRVRVGGEDRSKLAPPSPDEQKVLARVGAPANVRLACQMRPPPGRYRIVPLLPASAGPVEAYRRQPQAHGGERYVAILFADLRGFTSLSEGKLPYDVVFLLNRYFRSTGQAIEAAGGRLDKFIGDGVMAIFGLNGTPETACRQALEAARRMGQAVVDLNKALADDLDQPLRIGIGLHAGLAIVGEMGHGRALQLTAIGDTVNTASRIESATKELAVELVVSEELLKTAGVALENYPRHDIDIRGRQGRLAVYAVPRAGELTALSSQ